jgi:hypothetical protein
METLVYYVLPNVAMFGSLYLVAKGIEHATWYVICNYETHIEKVK